MAYDLIKISALPETTPDDSQDIVIGDGDYAKRIKYADVKEDMVGTSPSYTTDTEPYLMRQTAHTGIVGKCALDKLVGGSLGWNQLVQNGNFASTSNWTAAYGGFTVTGNVATITATAQWGRISQNVSVLSGHKYLFGADLKGTTNNYAQFGTSQYLSGTSWEHISFLYSATSTTTVQLMIGDKSTSGWQAFNAQNVQVLDLTAMFGSTIADYVYGLGSTNGIAWLSKYIDLGTYHAYDAGSIQSVQATAHVTTGFNQWDEAWELGGLTDQGALYPNTDRIRSKNYIPILPNTDYYYAYRGNESPTFGVCYYDGNKNFIGSRITFSKNNIRTSLANARYVKFYVFNSSPNITTYANNVCINISKPTGTPKNGDYVAYNGHSYPLGSDTLRGYPMLVNNKLAFDGDEKLPDGTIRRRYGILDLGSIGYALQTVSGLSAWRAFAPSDSAAGVSLGGLPLVCSQYTKADAYFSSDKSMWLNNASYSNTKYIIIRDDAKASLTAAQFKAAMSGIYLVYPLETETTESSTSFQKVQTIDADGTESFTTSTPVSVGHETQTADNILAALGWLGE